jgi:pimeloyl-ACP methyl ester carboxylesterase
MNKEIGQNWILLRGLTRESAHWGDFVPLMQAAFPHAPINLLDLPGTGRYFREPSPDSIRGITERVRADALEQEAINRPATILGFSLGGMVAWEWMKAYPEDICGAVLINISLAGLSPFYHRLRWQSYGKFVAMVWKRGIQHREPEILKLVSNRRDQYEQIAKEWIAIQRQRPVSPKNTYRQIIGAANYDPGEMKPDQPVLLLNSNGDKLVAPHCSEAIHEKWAIELRTHPWAGHDLTLDAGSWVISEMRSWMKKLEQG